MKQYPFIQDQIIRSHERTFTTEAARANNVRSREGLELTREQTTAYRIRHDGNYPDLVENFDLDPDRIYSR